MSTRPNNSVGQVGLCTGFTDRSGFSLPLCCHTDPGRLGLGRGGDATVELCLAGSLVGQAEEKMARVLLSARHSAADAVGVGNCSCGRDPASRGTDVTTFLCHQLHVSCMHMLGHMGTAHAYM